MKVKVRFLKDYVGWYNITHLKDSIEELEQWHCSYRGKSSKQRNAEGLIVVCYGQGEFDVFKVGEDIEIL